jgi:hypothetical protein
MHQAKYQTMLPIDKKNSVIIARFIAAPKRCKNGSQKQHRAQRRKPTQIRNQSATQTLNLKDSTCLIFLQNTSQTT